MVTLKFTLAVNLLKPSAMVIFLVSYTFIAMTLDLFLPNILAGVTEVFHSACMSQLPAGPFKNHYSSIVCGEAIPSGKFKEQLLATGLLHLMVVSGSHLALLDLLLQHLAKRTRLIWLTSLILPTLLIFTLANQCDPPIARSFLFFCLTSMNRTLRLNWLTVQRLTLAGIMTLPFCFSSDSFTMKKSLISLILSWLAGLALSAFTKSSAFATNTRIYLLLLPALLSFCLPSPATVAYNLILGPILAMLLFPISLLCTFVPFVATIGDQAWYVFESILNVMPHPPRQSLRLDFSPMWLGLYIVVVTAATYRLESAEARK